jgi:phytanoyl-CoA hydroxylase
MLSASQREAYETHGFLVVEDVIDVRILDAVRQEYAGLLDLLYAGWQAEGRVGAPARDDFWGKLVTAYEAGCDWFQPMDISLPGDKIATDTPMHFGPAVFDMVRAPGLLDIVEQLIGGEITSNPIQHVRIKPPATALASDEIRAHITSTDWHQDRAVALDEADQTDMVTCWLAITDATVENGCLQVLPKEDTQAILPHCPQRQTAIAPGYVAEDKAVPLPVPAGGVVLFHPLTPHASLVNKTDGFRWSFDLRFHVTGQPSGRSHFPEFVARSRQNPDTELSDWQEWKNMWEDARTRLAAMPHVAIHRWQSDSPACA